MIVDRQRYDLDYHPSPETIRFFVWLATTIKEDNKSAESHMQLIDFILSRKQFKCVECFRGASKSTLIDVYMTLYYVIHGHKFNHGEVDYILLVSDTVTQVVAIMEHILSVYEDHDALKEIFSIERSRMGDDPMIVFYNKKLRKRINMRGKGSGQKLRGLKMDGKRPDLIICDDIENDENVENKESREKLKKWFFNALIPSVNPNRFQVIFIGTPLHEDSLLMNLVESEDWDTLQLPVAEEYPPQVGKPLVSAWSDRFTADYLRTVYNMYKNQGRVNSFYQEMMLVVTPADNRLYDMTRIRTFDRVKAGSLLGSLTYYISVDLAISEKTTADFTAIVVIGVNENNDWFLIDGEHGRWKPDLTIDKIMRLARMYRPMAVVLEKVAFQLSMKTFIENEMFKTGTFFNLEMIGRNNSKLSVFKAFQPIVDNGKLFLPTDMCIPLVNELRSEMEGVSLDKIFSRHDDVLDAVSQLTLIDIIAGTPIESGNVSSFSGGQQAAKNPYVF